MGPDTPTAPCINPAAPPTRGEARRPADGDTVASSNHRDRTTNSSTVAASTSSSGLSGAETRINAPRIAPPRRRRGQHKQVARLRASVAGAPADEEVGRRIGQGHNHHSGLHPDHGRHDRDGHQRVAEPCGALGKHRQSGGHADDYQLGRAHLVPPAGNVGVAACRRPATISSVVLIWCHRPGMWVWRLADVRRLSARSCSSGATGRECGCGGLPTSGDYQLGRAHLVPPAGNVGVAACRRPATISSVVLIWCHPGCSTARSRPAVRDGTGRCRAV